MANLSALIGGGGLKSVARYTITSPTNNGDWSATQAITAVTDVSKTTLNLLTSNYAGTSADSYVGIRLANTTTVEYIFRPSTAAAGEIHFEVIEYN